MRMVAAVMYEQGLPAPYADSCPLKIEEVEIDGPREGEVLIEVRAAGLCHSDLSQIAGLRKRTVPVVMGHEGAGIVREVGRGVSEFKPGDHVAMTVGSGCGYCRSCVDARPVLCEVVGASRSRGLLMNGRRALTGHGRELYHHSGVSSFAQYAITVPGTLIKIDASIPFEIAAMFGCAVVTGAGSVFNAAKVRPGQSVAVFGLGGVGLNSVMAARISGASVIIGIDINENKFPLAVELGCTHTLSAFDAKLVETVRELTNGGVDFAFEISGSRAAMISAIEVTRKGGEIVCVGMGASGDLYQYPHTALVAEEKVLRGSLMGSCVPNRDLPLYFRYYTEGRLPVDRLKSGTMHFDELNRNLDMLERGEVLRQVLLPHG
ncbi:zinc-binding dehydrogenase [Paraburkholderia domus]|uniref:S-(Hydroxymethyl)glutathione dehydrogenase n=1 Tax=Paraburkholderia domus TaxID=2793075 RepID=A0A9N8N8F7_9BURK|nr:zinc-binding dehydrogenase [Paraburkholderia domus]MBK5053734.1 zinc-binding dehydrogenase [Burkholderia sp. R-70006]MBK5065616.1 zinc-binding dehydrogenase [Burkholderia sp. R-70199]MBK5122237.1 zinc-binding dehydrogenase [Burkholderia sp. R-69980]MBK5169769.1 zinc-binding dehydrogenase [Burkholderia sp. R-70211]MBK5185256.1 zinc-binding dehydrogenase [Burkholderia sp. R-69749]